MQPCSKLGNSAKSVEREPGRYSKKRVYQLQQREKSLKHARRVAKSCGGIIRLVTAKFT